VFFLAYDNKVSEPVLSLAGSRIVFPTGVDRQCTGRSNAAKART
jgi:hypothetical protein